MFQTAQFNSGYQVFFYDEGVINFVSNNENHEQKRAGKWGGNFENNSGRMVGQDFFEFSEHEEGERLKWVCRSRSRTFLDGIVFLLERNVSVSG